MFSNKTTKIIVITIVITILAYSHFQSMQPQFKAGDHVSLKGNSPHMTGQKMGIVNIVEPFAYGITFDGMQSDGIHKWYSQSELVK
jgi:hypothetical protein